MLMPTTMPTEIAALPGSGSRGPYRILICDDEEPARDRIRQMLRGNNQFTVVGECVTGAEAVDRILSSAVDLVLLDVQMPELTGFQVCEAVGMGRMPLVVFVTAYDEFALHAFDVHAVDYLLKPFDRERFERSLDRVRERLEARLAVGIGGNLEALLAGLKPSVSRLERLAFKSGGKVVLVKVAEIDWVEADGNYVLVHTASGSHSLRETMAWIEARLPSETFMRISRSAIVNLDRVRELQPLFHGEYAVILIDGTRLILSRTFRERLETLLGRT